MPSRNISLFRMIYSKIFFIASASLFLFTASYAAASSETNTKQTVRTQIFAPGVVSTDAYEFSSAMSEDGRRFYFTRSSDDGGGIYVIYREGSTWSNARLLDTGDLSGAGDPFLSADEQRLYFIAKRSDEHKYDIAFMERTEEGYTAPKLLDSPVNTPHQEYFVSFANNGDLYFSSNRFDENFELYKARAGLNGFEEPESLGPTVNSKAYDADPFVAPDGRYIIFTSNREGGFGRGYLYISFADGEGGWGAARNLGPKVNTATNELCPFVSRGGRFLFYTSNRDIYVIDTQVIEDAL